MITLIVTNKQNNGSGFIRLLTLTLPVLLLIFGCTSDPPSPASTPVAEFVSTQNSSCATITQMIVHGSNGNHFELEEAKVIQANIRRPDPSIKIEYFWKTNSGGTVGGSDSNTIVYKAPNDHGIYEVSLAILQEGCNDTTNSIEIIAGNPTPTPIPTPTIDINATSTIVRETAIASDNATSTAIADGNATSTAIAEAIATSAHTIANANANATATTIANTIFNATATSQANNAAATIQVNTNATVAAATSTAQANATATVIAATATAQANATSTPPPKPPETYAPITPLETGDNGPFKILKWAWNTPVTVTEKDNWFFIIHLISDPNYPQELPFERFMALHPGQNTFSYEEINIFDLPEMKEACDSFWVVAVAKQGGDGVLCEAGFEEAGGEICRVTEFSAPYGIDKPVFPEHPGFKAKLGGRDPAANCPHGPGVPVPTSSGGSEPGDSGVAPIPPTDD